MWKQGKSEEGQGQSKGCSDPFNNHKARSPFGHLRTLELGKIWRPTWLHSLFIIDHKIEPEFASLKGVTDLFQLVPVFVFPALLCRTFLRISVGDSNFCRFLAVSDSLPWMA